MPRKKKAENEAKLFSVKFIRLYSIKEEHIVSAYNSEDALDMVKKERCILASERVFDNCSEPIDVQIEEVKRGNK